MKQAAIFFLVLLLSCGSFGQQISHTDFKHLQAHLNIIPEAGKLEGALIYSFDVLEETDSIYIDAKEMEFRDLRLNGREVDFHNDNARLWILHDFKPSSGNVLRFSYTATPSQAMYFVGWDTALAAQGDAEKYESQVWTQGQGRNNSNWLPSFDDANEKLEFDLTIDFPEGYEVIASGRLQNSGPVTASSVRWEYDMEKPMSSYLVAIAAGNYEYREVTSASEIPIQLYYYPRNEKEVEPTYRHTQEIFDFLEQELGVSYPWQNYKQVPVRDFLYAGMENTGTTIFSDLFVIDSTAFIDRNYVEVNAHEMAHQWFGDLVTATSGEHHWLQEGFATYYALLAQRQLFGDDFYYQKLFESAEQLKELSDSGKGEALLRKGASSLTYYQKGAWALHILREEIGEEAFRAGVTNFLEKYKYQNVSTSQFIAEVEKTSGRDLSEYVNQWLRQSAFQGMAALNSLKKSPFIRHYLEIAALKEQPIQSKKELLSRALNFPVNPYIGQEVVYQLALEEPSEAIGLYRKAFETNDLLVRQAIAASLRQIPEELKSAYESLLKDDSYLTKEMALYNLWMHFPQERSKYLDSLEGVEGFNDKNIRTLWLALSLATPGYKQEQKSGYYTELSGYTAPFYPYQIRQNAFNYLFQLNSFSDDNLVHLVTAARNHQVTRFRDFSRKMLAELLQSQEYRRRFTELLQTLPEAEAAFLEQRLNSGGKR